MKDESLKNLQENVGKRIRHLRKLKNITQDTLSEMVDITPGYLGQIERGEKNPSFKTLNKIANALDTNVHNLLSCASDPREASIQALLDVVMSMPSEYIDSVTKLATVVKESMDKTYSEGLKKDQ